MRTLSRPLCALLFLLTALLAGRAGHSDAPSGVIKGVAVTHDGLALPGVHLTLSSRALFINPRRQTSDANGRFDFQDLPPGRYDLLAEKPSFQTIHQQELEVLFGRNTFVTVEMLPHHSDEVMVVSQGGALMIDTESAQKGQVTTKDFLQRVPTGRDYQSAVQSAGGVTGGGNPNLAGAAINENTYMIDGVNITEPVTGTSSMNYNYDGYDRVTLRQRVREARRSTEAAPAETAPEPETPAVAEVAPIPEPAPEPEALAAPEPTADTEAYADYGVNEMMIVEDDGLSTFAIDVDTASYTISRRKLEEGALPPQAAVRVEEFVNYFGYDYVGPDGSTEAPFAVDMEAAPNPLQAHHHLLRVGVQGREVPASRRKPMRLTFLVDVSGSMSRPDKLELAKWSLRYLVDQLGPEDSVALATYAGNTRLVLPPTSCDRKDTIQAAIADLNAGGSTAMASGVELAYQAASEGAVYGAENRVIVLSDGDANVGKTSPDAILQTIRRHAEEGITLSTIGFGMGNYKDTMMERLANEGDGNYFYIDDHAQAMRVFGEHLMGTLQVIAKDVKIQVEFNPDAVFAYRLIGYENRDIADRDFRNDRVDAGEIGAGHQVTALYDVVLREGADDLELATVRLRNKPPGPDAPAVEWSTVFPAELMRADYDDASADTRLAFAAASFAELLRGSPHVAELSWAELEALAADAARPGEADDSELLSLIRAAAGLSEATASR